ncbi:MAG: hypothetical protein ACNA70_05870 [Brevefilum sp.]
MKTQKISNLHTLLILCLLLLVAALPVLAQSGGIFDLTWSTVDGGGGASAGGNYALSGTIGQPDTGLSSGGGFVLAGGFWRGGDAASPPIQNLIFLPLVTR